MTVTSTETGIPGYVAGTWAIDPVHSEVGFSVRHMMVSKVRGKFGTFEGTITTTEDPLESSVTATVDLASISTGNDQRDGHLRSSDFFDTETHPQMTFQSTGIRAEDSTHLLDGELTIRSITRPVTLALEFNGIGPDAYGGTRAGFSATGEINRKDFGVNWNAAIEGGGAVVSDKVALSLEIEAVLNDS